MSRICAVGRKVKLNPTNELNNGQVNNIRNSINYNRMLFKKKINELEQFFDTEKKNMTDEEIQMYVNGISDLKSKYKQFKN